MKNYVSKIALILAALMCLSAFAACDMNSIMGNQSVADNASDDTKPPFIPENEVVDGLEMVLGADNNSYRIASYKGSAEQVEIPAKHNGFPVTEIDAKAFMGNKTLLSVMIPDSVETIGDSAFKNCAKLESVTIGMQKSRLASIGKQAFLDCYLLDDIAFVGSEDAWEEIEKGKDWDNHIGMKTDDRTYSLHFVDTSIFDYIIYSEGLNFRSNNDGTCYVSGIGSCTDTKVFIPPVSPTGDKVTSIGSSAFEDCSSLENITIPDSVTSISIGAFNGCDSLTSITIPKGVTSIGDYAFGYCSSLTSITIPDSVTSIGGEAFRNCSSLTSITILEGVTSIGYSAFEDCSSLTSITIPEGVTSIGNYAFSGCSSLESITVDENNTTYHSAGNCLIETASKTLIAGCKNSVIPADGSVTSIGAFAFRSCTSLTSITIPEGVTSIGDYAFEYCSSLESITVDENNTTYHSAGNCLIETASKTLIAGCKNSVIPADGSVTSIGDYAFFYCTSLTSITIPDSVTSIGDGAFYGCSSLESITVDENNTTYHSAGNCLIKTASKTLIIGCKNSVIPADGSVTRIGDSAFFYCTSLTSITIPEGVTSIDGSAFYNCSSLTNITIPDSVTSIGYSAFEDCLSLKTVYYTGTEEEWAKISINSGISALTNATIIYNYVPEE